MSAFNKITSADKITLVNGLLASIPNGPPLDENVQLVKGNGHDAVYLVQHGFKRPIANPHTFNTLGFDWEKIATL